MNTTLFLLLAYAAALIGLGLWLGRRVSSTGGFFVAGRSLGPGLLFATILAANIGAGTTIGAAGLGYRDGLAAWWWVGSAGIGTLVLGLWVGPRIWAVARARGHLTLGDYLDDRYGPSVRAIIAILLWFGTLALLAGQLIAMADIFTGVAGWPRGWGVVVGGVVATAYFAAGGLMVAAWVNLVQLVVMVLGFGIALPWALAAAGGWEAVAAAAPAEGLDFWRGGESGWVYLALLAPGFVISPGLIQKAYGAVDARAIRIGLSATAVALLLFAAVAPLLGMIARVYDPGLADHELALPLVLTVGVPLWLGTLGLAAVFSAELSSSDAILFMLSTSLSRDLYRRFHRPDASDASVLRVARFAALGGGALGIGLATVLPGVIESLTIFYALLTVSLFVPVLGGLYTRRAGTPEALAAIAFGVMLWFAVRIGLVDNLPPLFTASFVGLLGSALAFGAVLAVRAAIGRMARRG